MKKSIFMLVTIALILTGCGHNADGLDNMPDSSEDTEVSATETGKYSNKINHLTEDLGNNVCVDADIEIPDNYTDAISDYKAQSCLTKNWYLMRLESKKIIPLIRHLDYTRWKEKLMLKSQKEYPEG